MGAFASLLLALASGLLSLALWPIRVSWRTLRGWRALRAAKFKKVIFLGLDGLDPVLTERFMKEGKLPNLAALAKDGSYRRLRTTFPCLSPVAWSCFATGVNPARHNIFDFLRRNERTYLPELSSARVRPAKRWFGKPRIDMFRKSVPFWKLLGEHNIHSTILRVPITFPPEKFNGHLLSAMCTPDLRGTQGSFTFFSTRTATAPSELTDGLRSPLSRTGSTFHGEISGPHRPISFEIQTQKAPADFLLRIGSERVGLAVGKYTEWVPLKFGRTRGIARFLVTSTDPFEMYMTPINIDPERPALPISHPSYYAVYLAKLLGPYATLGLAEDTWAMNERLLNEDEFLDQAWLNHGEREAMFFNALDKTRRGVVACVFDASDRIQHMFFRCQEPDHPANADRDYQKYSGVIEDTYTRLDELVGRARKYVDDDTLFVVLSDHGFASFRRGVNLNAWLREHGYLHLKNGEATSERFFDNVDWERTKAYGVGLGGLYLNVRGREAKGVVDAKEATALKAEIATRLTGLHDPATGQTAILEAHVTESLYKGPYLDTAPDLLIGYNRGYRCAWGGAIGEVGPDVFEDNTRAWGGDHCIDPSLVPGVLFVNRAVEADDPGLEDLAPTTLTALGVDVPAHMEGETLLAT